MTSPIQNLDIEQIKLKPEDKKVEEVQETPKYYDEVLLDDETETRLIQLLEDEFEVIDQERKDAHRPEMWGKLRNLYYGKVVDTDNQFNLHRFVTKVKVDICIRSTMKAFFDSDPIFSVKPRPEFAKLKAEEAYKTAEKQAEYLDYEADMVIPLKDPKEKAVHSAYLLGLGWVEWNWKVTKLKRKREEIYRGKNEIDGIDQRTGQPIIRNREAERFIAQYPQESKTKYAGTLKKILNGETIKIMASYDEVVYNDPYPEFVEIEDIYVREDCDGYEGLKTEKVILRKMTLNWWKVKELAKEIGIKDEVLNEIVHEEKDGKKVKVKLYQKENFDIYKCWAFFDPKKREDEEDTGEDEEKLLVWWSKDKRKILKAVRYLYTKCDCNLVPYCVSKTEKGMYQRGIAEFTIQSSTARNAILNFVLEAWWAQNTITPIVAPESEIEKQFLEKRWAHGVPLVAREGTFRFLQEFMKPINVNEALALMALMDRDDDDVTGVSTYKTGRESPSDPDAPATKTIALLKESGLNIDDYIRKLLPSFNVTAKIILGLTYQMMYDEDMRTFQSRANQVSGGDMFKDITRDDMIAGTNIEASALSFDFDELNAKKLDVALLGLLAQWAIFTRNQDAVRIVLKNIVKGWSKKWSNLVDKVIVDDETFLQMKTQEALKALVMTIQQAQQKAQITGQPPEIDPNMLLDVIIKLQSRLVTNPTEEEVKAEQEASGA